MTTQLYRYESSHTPNAVDLQVFVITRATSEGWWFMPSYMLSFPEGGVSQKEASRWVSSSSRKRYCYPTKQEAWKSYRLRKAWRVVHLERQLKKAKEEQHRARLHGLTPPDHGTLKVNEPVDINVKSYGNSFDELI